MNDHNIALGEGSGNQDGGRVLKTGGTALMQKFMVLIFGWGAFLYSLDCRFAAKDVYGPPDLTANSIIVPNPMAVVVDTTFDVNCIMGSNARNICADTTNRNIAILYGGRSDDNTVNIMKTKIAYTTNSGQNWLRFGPYAARYPAYRRMYGGIDARGYSWGNREVIFGAWHEAHYRRGAFVDSSPIVVAFDSATFPSGDFRPRILPHSGDPEHNIWLTGVAVRSDDPGTVIASGCDYDVTNGETKDIFIWKSTDGGYNWSDPKLLVSGTATIGSHDAPCIRFGTGGYVFAYFQRDTLVGSDTLRWPYYIESTDNGETWIPAGGRCLFTTPPFQRYCGTWYTYDCEVVNNIPFVLNAPGVPHEHRDQMEFWKASGVVGDRIWTRRQLHGRIPPGADTTVREVSLVTGKDYQRNGFEQNIVAVGKISGGTRTWVRPWLSRDLGNGWDFTVYFSSMPTLASPTTPFECAKTPGPFGFDFYVHMVYCETNRLLYYLGDYIRHP